MRPRALVAVLVLAMLPPTAAGADTEGDDQFVPRAVAAVRAR